MEITFLQKNLSKTEESGFVDYVNKKIPAIESLLTKFAADAKLLNVSIKKFEKHTAFEVEFCLNLHSKTVIAKETSHSLTKAIDLTKDRLVAQVKKHLSQLQDGRSHRSIKPVEHSSDQSIALMEEINAYLQL